MRSEKVINESNAQGREDRSSLQCSEILHANNHENTGPSSSEFSEKKMQNGDIFLGSWRLGLPDGSGKYLWTDGCMYDGDWASGKATGRGKMSWLSGATYEGEFLGGNIQGVGTFTGANTTIYKGSWVMNVEHGLGRKWYPNGDLYEGLWKQGMQDGLGRYVWKNGDVYFGDWKGGNIFGEGSLEWANKESYHGQWQNGLKHGHGTYMWADGRAYTGTWSRGKKDGKGTFYPRETYLAHTLSFDSSYSIGSGEVTANHGECHSYGDKQYVPSSHQNRRRYSFEKVMHPFRKSKSLPSRHTVAQRQWGLEGLVNAIHARKDASFQDETGISGRAQDRSQGKVLPILEREYAQGVLISELAKDSLQFVSTKSGIHRQWNQAKQWRRPGETIIKGHRNYDLMLNLQLGIRYSVGRSNQVSDLEILPSDFNPRARVQITFPGKGSQLTPPHESVDFKWIDYCPVVFRKIRHIFKINAIDYIMSICGSDALRELSSPGKSGSVFYLSNDDCYMIKTLRRSEVKVLLNMLPNYYSHLCKHDNTLIMKIFGLHQVMLAGSQKIRVVVMGNVFCTELRIHRRFDFKGSWQGRSTKKIEIEETTTLKDLDLDFNFLLEPSWRLAFFEQIRKDCYFLESEQIMDYSLLLGVHLRAPEFSEVLVSDPLETKNSSQDHDLCSIQEDHIQPGGLALVAHKPKEGSFPGPHVRGNPLKAATAGHEEVDLMILGTNSRLPIRLGVNMPARAVCKHPKADNLFDDVILYFGIIDILQRFDIGKRVEHVYKSVKYTSDSISAVNPRVYSQRFQEFIHTTFPPNV